MYIVKIIEPNNISTHPVGTFWANGLSFTRDPRLASSYTMPLSTSVNSCLNRIAIGSNRFKSEVKAYDA